LAQEEENLVGVVKAVQWQDESKVIAAVLVVTTDEEDEEGKLSTYIDEYQIMDNRLGKELFEMDGETVKVSGIFVEKDDDTILLQVKSYEIIEAEQEEIIEEESEGDFPEEESEQPPK
jgi:hypothetical protein